MRKDSMQVQCLRTQGTSFSLSEKIQQTQNSTAHCVPSFHTKPGQIPEITWSPSISPICFSINVISVKCLSTPRAIWQCTGLGSTGKLKNQQMKASKKMFFTYLRPDLCKDSEESSFSDFVIKSVNLLQD